MPRKRALVVQRSKQGCSEKNPVLNSVRLCVLCASVVRLDPNRLVAERYRKRHVVACFVRCGWAKPMLNSVVRLDPNRLVAERYRQRHVATRFVRHEAVGQSSSERALSSSVGQAASKSSEGPQASKVKTWRFVRSSRSR